MPESAEWIESLAVSVMALPYVRTRESRMAGSDTIAMCVPDRFGLGPPEAFIDDHEFCHLPPPPGGSLHLTLPSVLMKQTIELGWGEAHLLAGVVLSANLVTVYAPRNGQERDVVLSLLISAYHFARGTQLEVER